MRDERGRLMFIKEDTIYSDMIERSSMQWLNDTMASGDLVNQQGAKLTVQYVEQLQRKIKELEDKNALKDTFLKQLKNKIK